MNKHTNFNEQKPCSCGKTHRSSLKACLIEEGAIAQLPCYASQFGGKKAYLLSDVNTFPLAGENIIQSLKQNEISCVSYMFPQAHLEPDEQAVGSAVMHYDASCDMVITLGSGVLNDIGKIISKMANIPHIVVATAPSMDGYASASSSMAMDGVKVTLATKCPEVVIGDLNIVKNAPIHMLKSGLGDMLAKYVSICEWRISHLITGEYYCEEVATYIRDALSCCTKAAPGLLNRESKSVKAVLEGLIACGCAMEYAGLSRPASGIEHYFSHIWDMRGLEFGTDTNLHGIQCAVGTHYALKAYEQIKNITPDFKKASAFVKNFCLGDWFSELKTFIGTGADAMIALEEKEQKYSSSSHEKRLAHIINHWDDILSIIIEELPSSKDYEALLSKLQMPKSVAEIGLDESILPLTFKASKDIRDKYVLSRLAWDLGVLDEIKF